jgi:hypothetical protein
MRSTLAITFLTLAISVAGCSDTSTAPPAPTDARATTILDAGHDDVRVEEGNVVCANVNLPGALVQFTNMRVQQIASRRAVVLFETSVATTCEVEWGVQANNLDQAASDPNMDPQNPYDVNHTVPLEDLPPNTTITFRARATTPQQQTSFSTTCTFATAMPAANEPAWTNIAPQATVTGVSSNFGGAANDQTWGVKQAFDNKMGTEWSSNGDGDAAWFSVDLGRPITLVGFGFRSRKMTDGSSIVESMALQFDNDQESGPYQTPNPDQTYKFSFSRAVTTQKVRWTAVKTTGGNTGVKELQLFVLP